MERVKNIALVLFLTLTLGFVLFFVYGLVFERETVTALISDKYSYVTTSSNTNCSTDKSSIRLVRS